MTVSSRSPVPRRDFLRLAGAAAAAPAIAGMVPAGVSQAAQKSVVVVSRDFGFDPDDSTSYLQAALDSSADVVVIDDVDGQDWVTGPLFVNRDDLEVRVEPAVTVRAKLGAYPGLLDSLITIVGRRGISLIGYGATFAMNKGIDPDYDVGEWRMVVMLRSASDISIEGLTLRDSGGDGVYVGGARSDDPTGLPTYCSNITLRNVACDNNRRCGLAVITVEGLLAEGCAFINTSGTSPECGVDFEPNGPANWPGQRISNVTLRDCVFTGNNRSNVLAALMFMDLTFPPVSILLDRVRVGAHVAAGTWPNLRVIGPGVEDPGGVIEVRDALIHPTPLAGSVGVFHNKAYDGLQVRFTRTGMWSWDTERVGFGPISIGPVHGDIVPEYGNVAWTDSSLFTNIENPFLHAYLEPPDSLGMANLQGDLTVVNPPAIPEADYGASPHDIGLDVTALTAAPTQTVRVTATPRRIRAGRSATLTFHRTTADLSDSLAIAYELSGTAVRRYDYEGLPGVAVIPAGRSSVNVRLRTLRHDRRRSARTVRVAIQPFDPAYTARPGRVTVSIT